jgi:hypothetical protein
VYFTSTSEYQKVTSSTEVSVNSLSTLLRTGILQAICFPGGLCALYWVTSAPDHQTAIKRGVIGQKNRVHDFKFILKVTRTNYSLNNDKDVDNDTSRVSSGSIVSDYVLDDRAIGVRSPRGQRIFPQTSVSRPALGPTQPPVQWVPGVLSPGVKARTGRDDDHSPPYSAEVRNE